jgi:hypothetical protein
MLAGGATFCSRGVPRRGSRRAASRPPSLDGKDLCRVAIQPSPRPAFIKEGQFEHLYIRTGNSTRLLTTKEAVDYCKTRWS